MGGTVYKDAAGTQPAASVEVRVVDKNGVAQRAFTDADGNFYVKGGALAGPASAGARNTASSHLMSGTLTDGNCNGCHQGGQGTARIHLP